MQCLKNENSAFGLKVLAGAPLPLSEGREYRWESAVGAGLV